MTEIRAGIRGLLSNANLYRCFQQLMGAERARQILANRFLAPEPGQRVLDIGCGPADILSYLPAVQYLGIDPNPDYIKKARQRYGRSGQFKVSGVDKLDELQAKGFSLIQSLGVLHHLKDKEATGLFRDAAGLLIHGGRVVTVDAVYLPGQRFIARKLIANDRGCNVRSPAGYQALAAPYFKRIETSVWSDIYRVPYDVFVMTCSESIE